MVLQYTDHCVFKKKIKILIIYNKQNMCSKKKNLKKSVVLYLVEPVHFLNIWKMDLIKKQKGGGIKNTFVF